MLTREGQGIDRGVLKISIGIAKACLPVDAYNKAGAPVDVWEGNNAT